MPYKKLSELSPNRVKYHKARIIKRFVDEVKPGWFLISEPELKNIVTIIKEDYRKSLERSNNQWKLH